jgi:hypothetical protein
MPPKGVLLLTAGPARRPAQSAAGANSLQARQKSNNIEFRSAAGAKLLSPARQRWESVHNNVEPRRGGTSVLQHRGLLQYVLFEQRASLN